MQAGSILPRPGQGSTRFRRRFQRFRRRSGRLWCRARSGSTGFWRRFPGQVQRGSGEGLGGFGAEPGQVRVPEKVPEKVRGSLGAKPSQVPENVRLWCRARSG